MMHYRFKQIFFYLIFFLGVTTSPVWSAQSILSKKDVKSVMQDLFVYHVEYKEMNPEVMKRAFYFYIEQFDILKAFLTEKEVTQYLKPSSKMIQDAVDKYNSNDLQFFEELQALVQNGIQRSRKNRAFIRAEVEEAISNHQLESTTYELPLNYPKSDAGLLKRQKEHMVRFIKVQEKSTPYAISKKDYKRMFDYYESRMREYENMHFVDPEVANYQEELEHQLALHTLKAMARSLDAHTAFFSPEEARGMQSSLSKSFVGIGLLLQRDYRGITVREVLKGGPAERVGKIDVGDQIVSIDHRDIEALDYREVVQLLEGQEDSEVTLLIRKMAGSVDEQMEYVTIQRGTLGMSHKLIEASYEPCDGGIIGKITLNSFYNNQADRSSAKDMRRAIEEFKQKGELKGVILDLRENTGGFLIEAVEVSGLFITNGVVVVAKFADGKQHFLRDLDGKVSYDGPLVLLTSRLSASSSEIVAGTLQDYGVALIVGDPRTFGKATIQYQTLTIPKAKHYFKVTIGRYYTVSGRCPQLEGVKADILVPSHYYKEKIGEQYLMYPLAKDSVDPAFEDKLADLEPKAKDIFTRFYLPSLQKKTNKWRAMLPELSKNSARRIAKSSNYQMFLRQLNGEYKTGEAAFDESQVDLQMEEAMCVIKDMIQLDSKTAVKEKVKY
jgi:carboxyl-terminal processing protease